MALKPSSNKFVDTDPSYRKTNLGTIVLGILVVIAYAVPLVWTIWYGADFTALANESLAYRYFAVDRIKRGEGGNIWLPQGHFTSAMQHGVMLVVDWAGQIQNLSFRQRLNAFAFLTAGVNVILVCVLMLVATRRLAWEYVLLISVVILAPIYAASSNGLSYHLLPDYLSVSVVLLGFGVLLVALQANGSQATRPYALRLGTLIGVLVGNKITLAIAAFQVFLPSCAQVQPRVAIWRYALHVMIGACAASVFILLVFYSFRVSSIREMVPQWWRFVRNPGTEPDFWSRINEYTRLYFGYGIAYSILAVGIFLGATTVLRSWSIYRLATVAASLPVFAAGFLFIYRRPAQTTFFEVFCLVVFSSSVLLATLPPGRPKKFICALVAMAWLTVAVCTFPLTTSLRAISGSKTLADERWKMFQDTVSLANGQAQLVLFPTNEFHHDSVHELLLKGAARFPTWSIDTAGQRIIERFSPNTRYVNEYGGPMDLAADLKHAHFVIWFDRIDFKPLVDRYPLLAEVKASAPWKCDSGEYHDTEGRTTHTWSRCKRTTR